MYTNVLKKFFRTVYEERLVFYSFKNFGENAYLAMKNTKTFQGPKVGPEPWPIRAHFFSHDSTAQLAKMDKNLLGPPLAKS